MGDWQEQKQRITAIFSNPALGCPITQKTIILLLVVRILGRMEKYIHRGCIFFFFLSLVQHLRPFCSQKKWQWWEEDWKTGGKQQGEMKQKLF